MKRISLSVILTISLLVVGCNTENSGVFIRISESVEKVDVGAVTLATEDAGGTLLAHTYNEGLQSYDPATRQWTRLIHPSTDLAVIVDAPKTINKDHISSNGNDLYFATTANEGEQNLLFKYDASSLPYTASDYDDSYRIIRMAPSADLMLIDDGGTFKVVNTSEAFNASDTDMLASAFAYDEAQLLAISSSIFLVSGFSYDAVTETYAYQHKLYDGGSLSINTTVESLFVAMHEDTAGNFVFITNDGDIYYGSDIASLTKGAETLPLPDTNMSFRTLAVLRNGDDMYVQGAAKNIYKITTTDGNFTDVSDDFPSDLVNVEIYSFLTTVGGKHYVGTKDNGIIEFDFP